MSEHTSLPGPHGVDDEVREVPAGQWIEQVREAAAEYPFLDWLGAVDEIGRSDEFRVVLRLVDHQSSPPRGLRLQTRVPRQEPVLASCTPVLPGASWHEREAHDFFGIVFDGGDQAPLLNHRGATAPLRKDFVLGARAAQPWPGTKEPGGAAPSRRKMAPPGVPDAEVWGARDHEAAAPTAEEIAAAVAGGRVRRRR